MVANRRLGRAARARDTKKESFNRHCDSATLDHQNTILIPRNQKCSAPFTHSIVSPKNYNGRIMQVSQEAFALVAAKSSAGSNAFALISLLVISLLVLLLLRYFLPLRSTPAYLLVPIFLALALPVSVVLLVPIDLASSSSTADEASRGIWLPDRVLLVAWRIAYWLTFALTW